MASNMKCFLNQIYDPNSQFIAQWKRFMFVVGLVNFFIDPLVMYIPNWDESRLIIGFDSKLAAILAALKIMGDCFLVLDIIVKFRTAYEAPGYRVFNRKRLIEEPKKIATKYVKSTFTIDLIAALPMPEVFIWLQIQASKSANSSLSQFRSYVGAYMMFWIQICPRLFDVYYFKMDATRTLMNTGMSGAFYNLLCFTCISHVFGAVYYFLLINWILWCRNVVDKEIQPASLKWDQLLSNCTQNKDIIEQGIFASAITNKIWKRNFIQKVMFCFSWGLKSVSSLGQNFTTSFSTIETTLSIMITLWGLIIFADLVTRMQAGIQSMEEREERQRTRLREVKEWMDHHQLPLDLKERVDLAIQSEWAENGINDEAILDSLPMDLRSEIRKYLYMDSICKLPKFANMDAPLVEAVCQHLKTLSGKEGTYIAFEGDTVKQTLFIVSGQLELSFRDRGNSSLTILGQGECCGQELVTWASQPATSMDNLPISSWTIKCLTDVEAFVLQAYDMKILATQFAHNQEFQRAFKQHYP